MATIGQPIQIGSGRYNYTQRFTGNSHWVSVPYDFKTMTVQVSSVTAGEDVNLEYSLSSLEMLRAGTGIWHPTSISPVSTDNGIEFRSPVNYVRCTANGNVSYTLEMLI